MADLAWGSATHAGLVRSANEDSHLADPPVFVVADGMGGHAHGEVASDLVVKQFERLRGRRKITQEQVAEALNLSNGAIWDRAAASAEHQGMGTTIVGLAMVDRSAGAVGATEPDTSGGADYWLAFNVGDSRLYRWFGGELTQVSVDHSYVQELVDAGKLAAADVEGHPDSHVVTRALGTGTEVSPDYWLMPVRASERFLLCSDGLSGEVEDEAIGKILADETSPAAAASALVADALAAGGRDNITVVIVDVVGDVSEGGVDEDTLPRRPLDA